MIRLEFEDSNLEYYIELDGCEIDGFTNEHYLHASEVAKKVDYIVQLAMNLDVTSDKIEESETLNENNDESRDNHKIIDLPVC